MITELLETAINEVMVSKYEITEFQLGGEPYHLLKKEVEKLVPGIKIDIHKINYYKDIPVRQHPSKDAVMYSIQLKKNKETFQRQIDVNIG